MMLNVDSALKVTLIHTDDWKHLKSEIPKEATQAFRFYIDRFGLPSGTHEWYLFPGGGGVAIGLIGVPMTRGEHELGGIHDVVGGAIGQAWFGPSTQLASYREHWMHYAVPAYMSVLYAQNTAGNAAMYTTLNWARSVVEYVVDKNADMPLVVAGRTYHTTGGAKGLWLLHMLRILMFDVEHMSDAKFNAFLRDVITQANEQRFSNADFCRLAEQHFGGPLDWFFAPWLYKRDYPTFESAWKSVKDGDSYFADMHIVTTGVAPDNVYPVMFRVKLPGGSVLLRQAVAGAKQDYRIGPFTELPTDVRFNEYESVLCHSKIRKL
jgi:hypothetical protein